VLVGKEALDSVDSTSISVPEETSTEGSVTL
jgi:hypothetical protein